MNQPSIWGLLKQTLSEWEEDKVLRLAAALAFYTVFSIAPLLIIAIAVAGLVFGQEAASNQISTQLSGLMGTTAADAVQEMVKGASQREEGILATIIGVTTLLVTSSGVFGELHDSLNTIWEVTPKPGRGFLGILKDRFISFTMVLGVGFLLLVSLAVSAALSGVGNYIESIGMPTPIFQALNLLISFGVITMLFAAIYKVLPDVEIRWRDVWVGAAVTAFLFTIGKFAIGQYLGRSTVASTYGAVGSLAVLLLWVYYSAVILFTGAEFTQVYANAYGSRLVPSPGAVPVTEEARAQQGLPRTADVKDAAKDRTPRPSMGSRSKAVPSTKRPESVIVVTKQLKKLEHQRYIAAVIGFLVALVVGALRGTKTNAAADQADGTLHATTDQ